jgi:hypothetical protein
VPWVGLASLGVLFLIDAALHADGRGWRLPVHYRGEAWIGRQPGVTGVLVDDQILESGGLWYGSIAPQIQFSSELLCNPLISYVLVRQGTYSRIAALQSGVAEVHRIEPYLVMAREH